MRLPYRCHRIVSLLDATEITPSEHDPFRRSVYDALMTHVRSMMKQAEHRLHYDPREACLRAGLVTTEDALFAMDMLYLTGRVPKASISPINATVVHPPPSRAPFEGPILWFAANCATSEALTRHRGITAAGHFYEVSQGNACLIAYRVRRGALPILIRHIAIWLCAESDDPAIASVVDQMLVADRLAA